MKIVKKLFRKVVFPLFLSLKIEKLFLLKKKGGHLIIMYHGVSEKNCLFINGRHLIKEEFEKQIKYLKENFLILPLKDVFDQYRKGLKSEKEIIAITFDDGYKNNLDVALPILEKYNVPATFFISSVCMEDPSYVLWADAIDILLYSRKGDDIQAGHEKFERKNGKYLNKSGQSIHDYIKHLSYESRDKILAEMYDKYGFREILKTIPNECYQLLNKEELIRLASSPLVEIGSHGHKHFNLGLIGSDKAHGELSYSLKSLKECTEKEIISIAYPDGDYNEFVKEDSIQSGYINLLAVNYKLETDPADKNILPRFGISNTTTLESNMINLCRAFSSKAF